MDQNNQKEIYFFGAAFIIDQVKQLEAQVDGVFFGEDIEYIHRMRVASRRLRTGLNLFKQYFPENFGESWRNAFKGITRALGNARDLDIQIQLIESQYQTDLDEDYEPGYQRLLLRLRHQRLKAQQKVTGAIQTLQDDKTLEAMHNLLDHCIGYRSAQLNPALVEFAFNAISESLDQFLSYQEILQMPDNSDKLHAMRIAGKHLRYKMEIFEVLYKGQLFPFIQIMKKLQDQLGEIHDCDVWVSWLPEFINQERSHIMDYFGQIDPIKKVLPGIHYLIEDRKITRQKEFDAFLVNWQTLKKEQTWENLRKIIEPFKIL
jgi:CHAD domain-containing protein